MSKSMKRNESGQFIQSFDDDKAISVLVSAERPLSTSEVAERMDVPRTTAHDGLRRIQDDYPIETWLMDGSTRCWDVEGNWGDRSFLGVFNDEALRHYFETGEFPSEIDHSDIVGLIDEMQLEYAYRSHLFPKWRYEEVSMLADLFDMGPFEFANLTQNEIYEMMHDGKMEPPIAESVDDTEDEEPQEPEETEPTTAEKFSQQWETSNVTQKAISERAGVAQPKISAWKNGYGSLDESQEERVMAAFDELSGE